jgi:hypothetical protein
MSTGMKKVLLAGAATLFAARRYFGPCRWVG